MTHSKYYLSIGTKTRFLNLFRQLFRLPPLEALLVSWVKDLPAESLWKRLVPPNYLFPRYSQRLVQRNGINFELDINDYVDHAVYFGSWDDGQRELFELAKNQTVIIDVGVNIGAVALMFSKTSPNARIFGFEPDSANFAKAQRNISLNGSENISLFQKGLGVEASIAKLFRVNETNKGMNRIFDEPSDDVQKSNSSEVEIIGLDAFVEQESLDRIDLIKIDVEGYELKVLKGSEESLRRFKPNLFVELDDEFLREQGDSARGLVGFLEQLGYEMHQAGVEKRISSNDDFAGCHIDIVCQMAASSPVS